MNRRLTVATAAVLFLGLAGCGQTQSTATGTMPPTSTPPSASAPPGGPSSTADPTAPSTSTSPYGFLVDDAQEVEYAGLSLNQLVNQAQAAVIGTAVQVDPPRWNSPSGEPWFETQGARATPLPYRDVFLTVQEAIFPQVNLPAAPGQTVKVRLRGDGTPTGARLSSAVQLRYNQSGGVVEVGDRMLLLLREQGFPMQDGTPVSTIQAVNGYPATWQIKDGVAVNVDPSLSAPLAELLGRISDERARG